MIKQYIKQAWVLLKQNRFYTTVYILGTAVSIAFVMLLALVFYIQIANMDPEDKRDRMLYLRYAAADNMPANYRSGGLSRQDLHALLDDLEYAEIFTIVYGSAATSYVQPDNKLTHEKITVRAVDDAYWKVFNFRFIQGKPFSREKFQSGVQTVVITESLSRKLFGTTSAVGKELSIDFKRYRIAGVVSTVSYASENTFADAWIPYSAYPDSKVDYVQSGLQGATGNFEGYVLARSKQDKDHLKSEIVKRFDRYAASLLPMKFSINGQPDSQWQMIFRNDPGSSIDFNKILLKYGFIIILLLLVPAISVTGLNDSQMEKRFAEMGVRRSFGATKSTLLRQLVYENLLFTAIGGLLGLLLSYLFLLVSRKWIIHLVTGQEYMGSIPAGADVFISPGMLFNLPVFLLAIGFCLVFNMLSAFIPAWRVTRREIVYSLTFK